MEFVRSSVVYVLDTVVQTLATVAQMLRTDRQPPGATFYLENGPVKEADNKNVQITVPDADEDIHGTGPQEAVAPQIVVDLRMEVAPDESKKMVLCEPYMIQFPPDDMDSLYSYRRIGSSTNLEKCIGIILIIIVFVAVLPMYIIKHNRE